MASDIHLLRLVGAVADLTAWLQDQSVRGAVVVGLAANLLGRPRVTNDVDAVVLLEDLQVNAFLDSGAKFGFLPRISDAAAFATKSRVLLLIHNLSNTNVDVSLGILPFEIESVDRASVVTAEGISFPIIA